jgi:hypothetical protein
MPEGSLTSEIVAARSLSETLVQRLYALHEASYDATDPLRFRSDLAEKEWVILLRSAAGDVVGFSTQRTLDAEVHGRPVRALFSGDTVIDPDHWGEQTLARAWCRLAGGLKATCRDRALYWFLISKGHRTYMYLPAFFREFHPRVDRETPPFEAELIRVFGRLKFGDEFDEVSGLVRPRGPHDRLKPELDATLRRLANRHVAYFRTRNPRYGDGHELACVAEIDAANMRGFARRELMAALPAATA